MRAFPFSKADKDLSEQLKMLCCTSAEPENDFVTDKGLKLFAQNYFHRVFKQLDLMHN
jgi:hypothetical protein